jgi:hypothetical protein
MIRGLFGSSTLNPFFATVDAGLDDLAVDAHFRRGFEAEPHLERTSNVDDYHLDPAAEAGRDVDDETVFPYSR